MDSRMLSNEEHPVHPLLLSLPFGLWGFSLLADCLYRSGRGTASWDDIAFFTMFAGLVTAMLAALPGLIDRISGALARRPANGRLELNLIVIGLYVLNLCLRAVQPEQSASVWMSFAGITLLTVAGGLGAEQDPPRVRDIRIETRRHATARSA